MITETVKRYSPIVGMTSLVGVHRTDYPLSFGNYMSLHNGPYIVNMWAENLTEWARQNPVADIEVTELSDGKHVLGFISDDRLSDWLNEKLCVTGHGWGSRELCEAALEFAGIELTNQVCGCEKPEESPSMYISMKYGGPKIYICMRCKRSWQD